MKSHHDVEKSTRSRPEPVHEALHDDFFDAGEQGLYEGGHGSERQHVLDEDLELEHGAPRVIVRTPEQEMRRNRMMRVVGVVVGVVLGVLVFAVLRGRGNVPEDAKPGAAAPGAEQPVAPAPVELPPAAVSPPPPPPPPPEPAAAPPEPAAVTPPPVEKPVVDKPVVDKPAPAVRPDGAAAAPRPRPAPAEPAAPKPTPAQPRPATPAPAPVPTGKPPTVSFPD